MCSDLLKKQGTDKYVGIVSMRGQAKSNLRFLHRCHSPEPATATAALRGNRLFLLLFQVKDQRQTYGSRPGRAQEAHQGHQKFHHRCCRTIKKKTKQNHFFSPVTTITDSNKSSRLHSSPENSHLLLGKEEPEVVSPLG